MSAPSPDNNGSASQFALSFERITVESLAIPWHQLEEVTEAIQQKRQQVEVHTESAMEHLRSIALLNGEVNALEKRFSSIMSTIVSERTRTQEKLRSLVMEWERKQVAQVGERVVASQAQHENEMAAAQDEVKRLKKALKEKSKQADDLQGRVNDMQAVLREHNLDAVGPLLQSLSAKRLNSSTESSKRDSRSNTDAQVLNLSRENAMAFIANHEAGDRGVGSSAIHQQMLSETEELRGELVRLQAELAAAKRESKMRRDEIDALRYAKEETRGWMQALDPRGTQSVAGGGFSSASTVASDVAPHQAFYQLHSGRSIATSSTAIGGQSVKGASLSTPPAVQPSAVSVGLDLGTRRQQQGLSGVHVVSVAEGSPAYVAGIRPNDVIVAWSGRVVGKLEDIAAVTKSIGLSGSLEIHFIRPSSLSQRDELLGDEEIHVANIALDGRLDGPYNHRREHFSSSK